MLKELVTELNTKLSNIGYATTLYAGGQDATSQTIDLLKQEKWIKTYVVDLAPYKDPDELITKEGIESYKERIKAAKATNEWQLDYRINKATEGKKLEDAPSFTEPERDEAIDICRQLYFKSDDPRFQKHIENILVDKFDYSSDQMNVVLKKSYKKEDRKLDESKLPDEGIIWSNEQRLSPDANKNRILTNIPEFDENIALVPGNLVMIAGEPSEGKTMVATTLAMRMVNYIPLIF